MDFSEDNIIKFANYILDNHTTIRATAKEFSIPKSTMHHYLSVNLKHINYTLYCKVKKLMEENFSVKHLHGGESTKHKYAQLKKEVDKFDMSDMSDITDIVLGVEVTC